MNKNDVLLYFEQETGFQRTEFTSISTTYNPTDVYFTVYRSVKGAKGTKQSSRIHGVEMEDIDAVCKIFLNQTIVNKQRKEKKVSFADRIGLMKKKPTDEKVVEEDEGGWSED